MTGEEFNSLKNKVGDITRVLDQYADAENRMQMHTLAQKKIEESNADYSIAVTIKLCGEDEKQLFYSMSKQLQAMAIEKMDAIKFPTL